MKSSVYKIQNVAIHKARAQLEGQGVLNPWSGLDQVRAIAAEINLGIASISKLSLDQRHQLIDRLIAMGAQVKNPVIYDSDRNAEAGWSKKGQKVARFRRISEPQLRMLDALAGQVNWREQDGYLRFCHKIVNGPRPLNQRQVTTLRAALQSLIAQQRQTDDAEQNKNTG